MLEERLASISEQLAALYIQRKTNPSPGLSDAIKLLEHRQLNFKDGLDLWHQMLKVYPNYDR